jgi:putative methanogenesis marker 13 metalloprotein
VESHGGFGEGDNTEGAIAVLNAAVEYGVIPQEEADRQNEMLRLATQVEKTRGMAQGKYIKPNFGDSKEKVARIIVKAIREGKKVAFVLNAKKETSYLFADILNCDFSPLFDGAESNRDIENLHFIANLDENIGLPRIRQHAVNITKELNETGIDIECITGGLDEYPITPRKAEEYLKEIKPDLVIVAGVPHALYVEELDCETIAVTDGPRLVQPLNELGYSHVIAELDAHSKTLGVDEIVDSDFGMMIRSVIEWELE